MRLLQALLIAVLLTHSTGSCAQGTATPADTVRIDALLDSAKALLGRGEHQAVITVESAVGRGCTIEMRSN